MRDFKGILSVDGCKNYRMTFGNGNAMTITKKSDDAFWQSAKANYVKERGQMLSHH